jgi:hypothetical protein
MNKRISYINASGLYTKSIFALFGAMRHPKPMRSMDEIRSALRDLKTFGVTQKAVGEALGLHQTRISEIAHGNRGLSYEEGVTLCEMLWPDDPAFNAGDQESRRQREEYAVAMADEIWRALLEVVVPDSAKRQAAARMARIALETLITQPADLDDLGVRARTAVQTLATQSRLPAPSQ